MGVTSHAGGLTSVGESEVTAEGPDNSGTSDVWTWKEGSQGSMQAVRLTCKGATVDNLVDALLSFGAASCSMEDANLGKENEQEIFRGPQPWDDQPKPGPIEKWNESAVTALFPMGTDVADAMERVKAALDLPELPQFEVTESVDQDWVQTIKDCYQPTQVAPGLWIVPSWSQPEDPSAVNVILEPGLAFGTGDHPTTRLCLQFLQSHIKEGHQVMDYGTGSGILAIAALKLGASYAVGVDTDPQALTSTKHNLSLNGIDHFRCPLFLPSGLERRPEFIPGTQQANEDYKQVGTSDELPKEGDFDVVVANILITPLLALKERITSYAKKGGLVALSGVIQEQVEEVREAYSPFLTGVVVTVDENWACVVGRRR